MSLRRLTGFWGGPNWYDGVLDTWGDLRRQPAVATSTTRLLAENAARHTRKVEAEYGRPVSKRRFYHLTGISENVHPVVRELAAAS
ncbi:MAG: hypothetical protein R3B91_07615 [Planctomycetaceae bacterium]